MRFAFRKLGGEVMPFTVDADDPMFAPDQAARYVRWSAVRQVSFLEIRPFDSGNCEWVLWRIECLKFLPSLELFTERVTLDEARAEIAKERAEIARRGSLS